MEVIPVELRALVEPDGFIDLPDVFGHLAGIQDPEPRPFKEWDHAGVEEEGVVLPGRGGGLEDDLPARRSDLLKRGDEADHVVAARKLAPEAWLNGAWMGGLGQRRYVRLEV